MRIYVPASVTDLRLLEEKGRLESAPGRPAFAVTPWVLRELGADDPEDEEAEYAVLSTAAEQEVAGTSYAAVLAFDLSVAELPGEGPRVVIDQDLPRRHLAAIHLPPDLDWYAAQELPDVLGALT